MTKTIKTIKVAHMKFSNIILFDIDFTLLDTNLMVENLYMMVSHESGLTKNEVDGYHEKYIATLPHYTNFDFLKFVDLLPIEDNIKNNIQEKYQSSSDIYTKYPDVDEVLSELKNKGYKLGIFSEGVSRFQETKLKNLHIDQYLEKEYLFITRSKRSDEFLDQLPSSIIIDDNIDVCNIVFRHNKHKIIHLDIKNKSFSPESDKSISREIISVKSLRDLLHIL